MAQFVVMGSSLTCTFGAAPSTMVVIRPTITINNMPMANIMDMAPMSNIMPFGMCSAPSNPAVIAATSAASGVFTPAPCIPATTTPWAPGNSKVLVQNMPAVMSTCRCMCTWGGSISVANAGQTKVMG